MEKLLYHTSYHVSLANIQPGKQFLVLKFALHKVCSVSWLTTQPVMQLAKAIPPLDLKLLVVSHSSHRHIDSLLAVIINDANPTAPNSHMQNCL